MRVAGAARHCVRRGIGARPRESQAAARGGRRRVAASDDRGAGSAGRRRIDPPGALARLARLREPAYEAAAHEIVDTTGLDVDTVAEAVLAAYEGVLA